MELSPRERQKIREDEMERQRRHAEWWLRWRLRLRIRFSLFTKGWVDKEIKDWKRHLKLRERDGYREEIRVLAVVCLGLAVWAFVGTVKAYDQAFDAHAQQYGSVPRFAMMSDVPASIEYAFKRGSVSEVVYWKSQAKVRVIGGLVLSILGLVLAFRTRKGARS
jgi:hypothetical protein